VEGYTTPGGYSGPAVLPIALRMTMEIAQVIRQQFPDRSLSGIGGIETGADAAQFLLLGADTVQVCKGVMQYGYRLVHKLQEELLACREQYGFDSIAECRVHSLQFVSSHSGLVARQASARSPEASPVRAPVHADAQWTGSQFVEQSDALARG